MMRRPLRDRTAIRNRTRLRWLAGTWRRGPRTRPPKGGLRKVDRVKRIGLGYIGIRRRLMGVEPILVFLDVAPRQD
jgi:hypothetical protein